MIADQYEDLNLVLPWHLSCDIACRAMMHGRTFDQQIEVMTKDGMIRHETMRQRWLTMKRANRELAAQSLSENEETTHA
jgi:hypothetical protein